ncbi:transcriptional regulator BetI [Rhizobium sp. BK491]|uniref:transcriptional regulator BetI n=1 Tax=Rhizobium sp. BK491 TaxID=2587009 RepID=UPI001615D222|nr:transcriptional regulator BetI [Rhizobium sp. BK491]MBB3570837.1 transcriptional repressor BetI [Rhizobium sp. BK491]
MPLKKKRSETNRSLANANATRKEMRADRRKALVDATVKAIYQYGFAGITVANIASIAGISAGNVHHYFGGKDALLGEAMRVRLESVRIETVRRMAGATTPLERLHAIIESNFLPSVFSREVCVAWLHFAAHSTHDERLRRLSRINARRLKSNLVADLKVLVGKEKALVTAETLTAMIDGMWMHCAHEETTVPPIQGILEYLDNVVTSHAQHHKETSPESPDDAAYSIKMPSVD